MPTARSVLLFLTLFACTGEPATDFVGDTSAAPLKAGQAYRIISVNSQQSLDVVGISKNPGAGVQQYPYWQSANQIWNFVPRGDGSYQIVSLNSGLCLDVVNISAAANALVQQWTCWNTTGQAWNVLPTGDGSMELQNVNSGMALDVIGISQAPGAGVQQYPYWGSANQKWLIQPVDGNGNPIAGPPPAASPAGSSVGRTTGVLGDGADPSIVYWNGRYYLTMADFAQHVFVFSSNSLQNILHDRVDTWTWPGDATFHAEAPDLAVVTDPRDGQQKLGIYLSCDSPVPGSIRVLLTSNPGNGFEDLGTLANVNGYDAHFMYHPNGNKYLFWSTFSQLHIIMMDTPWSTIGGSSVISTAQAPWELGDGTALNEAPAHVISGNTLNLIYSANAWNRADYLCGRLTLPLDADPMDGGRWVKDLSGPAFAQANGIAGPGSGTFFSDGVGTWWAYGSVADLNTGYRVIRAQVIGFDGNGVVQLGVPH